MEQQKIHISCLFLLKKKKNKINLIDDEPS